MGELDERDIWSFVCTSFDFVAHRSGPIVDWLSKILPGILVKSMFPLHL